MRKQGRMMVLGVIIASWMLTMEGLAAEQIITIKKISGKTEKEISSGQLFEDGFMPGYKESGEVLIKNETDERLRYALTEINKTSGSEALFQELKLQIKDASGNEIYTGALNKGKYEERYVDAGKAEKLLYTLSLPLTAGNEVSGAASAFEMKYQFTIGTKNTGGGNGTNVWEQDSEKMYGSPDPGLTVGVRNGKWKLIDQEKHLWKYVFESGNEAKDGWLYVYNPYHNRLEESSWYHFDKNGYMTWGWSLGDNGSWYFNHDVSDGDLGTLKKGWHHDRDDGQTYYLDEKTGAMLTGWQTIKTDQKEQSYYFATEQDTYKQNWFYNTGFGRWIYDMMGNRTYGSMYRNEKTPDGSMVDQNGAKIK